MRFNGNSSWEIILEHTLYRILKGPHCPSNYWLNYRGQGFLPHDAEVLQTPFFLLCLCMTPFLKLQSFKKLKLGAKSCSTPATFLVNAANI